MKWIDWFAVMMFALSVACLMVADQTHHPTFAHQMGVLAVACSAALLVRTLALHITVCKLEETYPDAAKALWSKHEKLQQD